MKRIISAISALAVMAGFSASCQKELASDNNSASVNTGLTVTATIADNGTKVSYAEDASHNLTPTWEVNDIIIGFDGDDKTYGYKVTAVNEGVATLAIITEGDFVGSATVDPADGTKMYMFYAPGKKPSDISGESLTVSLASQSKDVVPALMMAQATVAGSSLKLSFENKTAIIGIKAPTMATASKNYTGIAVSGTGINTEVKFEINPEGEFVATYQTPGTITKAADFISGADKKTTETVYIVACPLTTAADLTFIASNGEYFKKTAKTMAAGQYYYMTPNFLPAGALAGKFSVAEGKQILFSKGNLYAKNEGTTESPDWKWHFYGNQYDYNSLNSNCDEDGNREANNNDDEIDLFTWGFSASTSLKPIGTDHVSSHPNEFDVLDYEKSSSADGDDWGVAYCESNEIAVGTWRTLTMDEWCYLFAYDPSASEFDQSSPRYNLFRYGVTVCNKENCVVIAPDNWDITNNPIEDSYDADEWKIAEDTGLVCLPAAGNRYDSSVCNVGCEGNYWSSAASGSDDAFIVLFNIDNLDSVSLSGRGSGNSVRLITDVPAE